MLETGDLTGKCADLNALFVGLARAVNLPARDVYGLRVASSDFGYRSLGVGSPNVTRAQHCRAEVFLTGYGWVPVDPADVRKVVLEEKPQPDHARRPGGAAGAREAVRRVGDELARLQRGARREAARLERAGGRLPHVPAGGNRQGAARPAGSGQLQVHDHGAGDQGLQAVAPPQELPAPAVQPRQCSPKRMRRPSVRSKSKSKMLSGRPSRRRPASRASG